MSVEPTPGWHPDPSGGPGQRYWDDRVLWRAPDGVPPFRCPNGPWFALSECNTPGSIIVNSSGERHMS
jgi:hypothetical protein